MARPDSFFRIKSGHDRTSDLPWVSTMAASARRAPSLAAIGTLLDATTIRHHVFYRHAVKTCPQPAAVLGSWHLRGSRAWPSPIGGGGGRPSPFACHASKNKAGHPGPPILPAHEYTLSTTFLPQTPCNGGPGA